jgi:hypothetical protein
MNRTHVFVAAIVGALANAAASGGYLFATFKGEQTPKTEQVYFALSRDGRHWKALHGGEPTLVSHVGDQGVRDPFLIRRHYGKGFHLLATDLCINLNPEWSRARTAGSKSIVIWDSPDLVKWSEPRLVRVAPPDAGCAWAPEAIYDEERGDYLVFWASRTASDGFAKQRIWARRTTDFKTFGEPFVYIEKPTGIIDTTIVRDDGKYYRFSKNRTITLEESDRLAGPWRDVAGYTLTNMGHYEGPLCFQLPPGADGGREWCLMLDHFRAGEGYKAWVTDDPGNGKFRPVEGEVTFPFLFRHGSVLELTKDEYDRLKAADEKQTPVNR